MSMPGEHGPNAFTPEEVDEHLRHAADDEVTADELKTGERAVDGEVASGDVGDNERETEE